MLDYNQVTLVEVTFGSGSFDEWTQANGEIYPDAFLTEWEANYISLLEKELSELFHYAEIVVEEAYDQLFETKIDGDGFSYENEDEFRRAVEAVLYGVANRGEEFWTTPSLEAVKAAIEEVLDDRPVGEIVLNDVRYIFASKQKDIYWLDADIGVEENVASPDMQWMVGSLEDAASAFLAALGE